MNRLFFTLFILAIAFNVSAQDLSGTWEGQLETSSGAKFDFTLYLSKVGVNGYSGVEIEKMKKPPKVNADWNSGRPNVKISDLSPFGKKPTVTARCFGKSNNNTLEITELAIIDQNDNTTNWQMAKTPILLSYQNNGVEKLTSSAEYKFDLKKQSNDFPSAYSKYAFKEFISLTSVTFLNSKNENKISYNDKGTLTFAFANNSDIDFQFNLSFSAKEKSTGILGLDENIVSNMTLAKGQMGTGFIDLNTGFDLGPGPVHFNVEGTYRGISLFSKDITLETVPFYLTDKTILNKNSSQTLSALASYYGLEKKTFAPVVANLNQLSLTGNKLSPMWKAIFETLGLGGFALNESDGLQIAKKCYPDIVEGVRNGDAEADYLMFYANVMGLSGEPSRVVAGTFLKKSADAGFLPAMYDYALYLQKDQRYDESYALLLKCYDNGVQKAALSIGYFNQKGFGINKDAKKAAEWYEKGEVFGDAENLMHLAVMYSDGEDAEPDAPKAIAYANRAIVFKNAKAMYFLGKIYLNGRAGVPKNTAKAVALYKEAANLGSTAAMTALAYLYLNGSSGVVEKDEQSALYWTKKSAEAGGADCMALLANMYAEGKIISKSVIKERFWTNMALQNGIGQKDNTAQQLRVNEIANVISNIDLSDHYSLYQSSLTGNVYEVNEGADLLGGLAMPIFSEFMKRRSQQQEIINGVEYIYDQGGKKIFGGTLTSQLLTDIFLKKGQQIIMKAYGEVNLGFMAGTGGPNGIGGFQSYCVDPSIRHGAIMAGINNKWTFMGNENTYTALTDGKLQIAINDADYSNNAGYFDVVIEVK